MRADRSSRDLGVIETPNGVRYCLPRPRASWGCLPLAVAIGAAPVAGAILAGRYLLRHQTQLSPLVVMLSCLYVAQLIYLASIPIRVIAFILWRKLVGTLGGFELDLRGDTLSMVSRLGPIRLRINRSLRSIRRIIVQVTAQTAYNNEAKARTVKHSTTETGSEPGADLVIERHDKGPLRLLHDYAADFLVALAEDLRLRLQASADVGIGFPAFKDLGPIEIMEARSGQAIAGAFELHDRQKEKIAKWTVHLGGLIGLGSLSAAVSQTEGFKTTLTWLVFGIAWLAALFPYLAPDIRRPS